MRNRELDIMLSGRRGERWRGVVVLLLATTAAFLVMRSVGADTSGTPDTITKAAVAPATPNLDPPGPIDNAVEGTSVNIHAASGDGNPTFFGVNAARLCKSGLSIVSSSQM